MPGKNSSYLPVSSPSRGSSAPTGGISCCSCLTCCTCLHLSFIKSPTGVLKLGQALIALVSQMLLFKYGFKSTPAVGDQLGLSYMFMVTACSSTLVTASALLLCYVLSSTAFDKVHGSLFEVIYNAAACVLFLGSSSALANSVLRHLLYHYRTIPGFSAYPAMTAVYVMGYVLAALHGIDGGMALNHMRKQAS